MLTDTTAYCFGYCLQVNGKALSNVLISDCEMYENVYYKSVWNSTNN